MRNEPFTRMLLFCVALTTVATGCEVAAVPESRTEMLMGTLVEITVMPGQIRRDDLDAAIKAAFNEVRRIDGLMSTYKPDSEVSQINRLAPGEPLRLSRDTFDVIERAIEFNHLTNGAFDVTVGPLVSLWGFGSEGGGDYRVPTQDEIKDALRRTGTHLMELDKAQTTIVLNADGVHIDLSGIAKGYAVDRAVAVLRGAGVTHALVNAGGDIAVVGGKTSKRPWVVGVQRPVHRDSTRRVEIIGTLRLVGGAVATSGNYQQYFTVGDRTYSHIIDPRTGAPREHVPSITVVAPDCTTADAMATGLLVLGPEEGIEIVESLAGVEAVILSDRDGTLTATSSSGWPAPLDLAGT